MALVRTVPHHVDVQQSLADGDGIAFRERGEGGEPREVRHRVQPVGVGAHGIVRRPQALLVGHVHAHRHNAG